jgi:hypothetical protein
MFVCDYCYNKYPEVRDHENRKKGALRDIRALRWEQFDLMEYADDECIHISEFLDTIFCNQPLLRHGRLVRAHELWTSHNE